VGAAKCHRCGSTFTGATRTLCEPCIKDLDGLQARFVRSGKGSVEDFQREFVFPHLNEDMQRAMLKTWRGKS
jgi:hypothetical protein